MNCYLISNTSCYREVEYDFRFRATIDYKAILWFFFTVVSQGSKITCSVVCKTIHCYLILNTSCYREFEYDFRFRATIDYKAILWFFYCSIARKQNKVVQWFVKPLIVIWFRTHPVTVSWIRFQIRSHYLLNYPFNSLLTLFWILWMPD